MAEETASQTTEATPEPAAITDTVDAEGQSEGQAVEHESLFDEAVSEAELMGEEAGPATETKEAVSSPPKAAKETDPTPEAVTKEEPPADGQEKPPKGFVPLQALQQERTQRQTLSTKVQQLEAQLAAAKDKADGVKPADTTTDDFTVLSEEEFNSLVEEDPVEAIKYDRKLRAYEHTQAQKAEAAKSEQDIVDRSIGMMSEAVPGLYDQDNDANEQISAFATEKGFVDMDGLSLITDPRTRIIPVGGGKPRLLGETAAHLVTMLGNLFQESKNGKPIDNTAAVTEKVKAEVTKDLLSKLKQSQSGHMSLGDVPGDSGLDGLTQPLTEEAYAKLSGADKRRYLGG